MATKSANLYVRIEPDVKEKAEMILDSLGISASSAISMYYKQIIMQRGIPFDVKIPVGGTVNMADLSLDELAVEIERGLDDARNGRIQNASVAFKEIKEEFDI